MLTARASGSIAGLRSVRRKTSAWTISSAGLPIERIRSGTQGSSVGIVMWTGVPSPTFWPRSAAAEPSNTAARK